MKYKTATYAVCLVLSALSLAAPAKAQDALWRSYFSSAEQAFHNGNYAESEKMLQAAANSARRPDDSLTTCYYLGRVREQMGNYAQAERDYKTVLEYLGPKIWATLRPPDGTPAWDQTDAVDTEQSMNAREFLAAFRTQKEPMESNLAKPITTVDVLTDLGLLLQEQNQPQEAEQMLRQALVLSELRTESIPFTQPRILQRLATLYTTEGRTDEAAALRKQLDELRNKSMPEFDQIIQKNIKDIDRITHNRNLVATRLNNLALFCATHGDYSRADDLYNRALAACDSISRRNAPDRQVILRNYADLLQAMGKNQEAGKYLHQAEGLGALADSKQLKSRTAAQPPKAALEHE